MNVLFATTNFYLPQRLGGSESSTHDLCQLLRKEGIKCAVLSDLKANDFVYFKNRLKSKLCSVDFPCDTSLGYPVYRGWNAISGIDEIIRVFQPDIVIIQAGKPVLIANEFLKRNIKTIIYIRDSEFYNHGGKYSHHHLLNFISNSNFTANQFEKIFNLKSKVIPPTIIKNNYIVKPTRQKALFICPVPQKGVDLAFQLAEANPEIPFLFVESWHIPPQIKAYYHERACKVDNISWMKKQNNMKRIYSQTKLLLVPSIWNEAWGRVVTETQASGIPTIASNRGGLLESVGEGGITLEPENNFKEWDFYLKKFWFDTEFYEKYTEKAYKNSRRQETDTDFLFSEFLDFIKAM